MKLGTLSGKRYGYQFFTKVQAEKLLAKRQRKATQESKHKLEVHRTIEDIKLAKELGINVNELKGE